jgi:hypothetical protein
MPTCPLCGHVCASLSSKRRHLTERHRVQRPSMTDQMALPIREGLDPTLPVPVVRGVPRYRPTVNAS